MGVVEFFVIAAIAGAITTAMGVKSAVDAATDFVHARKGTKRQPKERREAGSFGKLLNQICDDWAAKHAIKEQKRRARLADNDHVTVGDWWARMRSEARRKALAKRGLRTDADIAKAARRHRQRMEREGLLPYIPSATSPDVPTAPGIDTERVTDPADRPDPEPPVGAEDPDKPYSPFAPDGEDKGSEATGAPAPEDLTSARTQVEELAERLEQAEAELAKANAALAQARAEAAAAASREGLAGYADATADHAEELRHAEEVAQRIAADRARLAADLAQAQEQLDLIAAAWAAREQPEGEQGQSPGREGDGFDGVVIDGEVVEPQAPQPSSTAPAALETKENTNRLEHHMSESGEITTLEATKPYVENMSQQASGSISLIEAAAADLSRLSQLSATLDQAMVNMENAIANLRAAEVAEEFIAQLVAARERYATAKANIDTVIGTTSNLATASEALGAAGSTFEGLQQEVAGHIAAADAARNTSVGNLSYMGINRS